MRVMPAGSMSKALTDWETKGGRELVAWNSPGAGMDVFLPNGVRGGKESRGREG